MTVDDFTVVITEFKPKVKKESTKKSSGPSDKDNDKNGHDNSKSGGGGDKSNNSPKSDKNGPKHDKEPKQEPKEETGHGKSAPAGTPNQNSAALSVQNSVTNRPAEILNDSRSS